MTCLFCEINEGKKKSLSVYEDKYCHGFMDKFPLSVGHLIVVSKLHTETISGLSYQQRSRMFDVANTLANKLRAVEPKIKAFNFVINDGKAAGQHIPHVHLHVIPRYGFDGWLLGLKMLSNKINPVYLLGYAKSIQTIWSKMVKEQTKN